MSNGYLLDTNICVYVMNAQRKDPSRRTKPESAVWERFVSEDSPLFTSDVTLGELHFGVERSEQLVVNFLRLEAFLKLVPALSIPQTAWTLFGKTKARLLKKGLSVADLDLVIACLAHVEWLVLVSNDTAFGNLPESFHVENWAGPESGRAE